MATTWAGTANNQGVTYDALNDAGFYTSCSPTTGLQLVRKDFLFCFPTINIQATALNGKTDNQILVKSDFVTYANSQTFLARTGGWSTCADAALLSPNTNTFNITLYYNGTFANSTIFRSNAALNTSHFYNYGFGSNVGFGVTLLNSTYNLYQVNSYCPF